MPGTLDGGTWDSPSQQLMVAQLVVLRAMVTKHVNLDLIE